MAIQTTYNFKGITIPNAYIRVARIFGSSREGWNSLIDVCVDETYTTVIDEVETTSTRKSVVESFNLSAPYNADERGYVSVYNALKAKYPDAVDV